LQETNEKITNHFRNWRIRITDVNTSNEPGVIGTFDLKLKSKEFFLETYDML